MELNEYAQFIRELGADCALVQGGGGNFALKGSDGIMHVKSSGVRFSAMQEQDFVPIALDDFREAFRVESERDTGREEHEAGMDEMLRRAAAGSGRPSMETAMHAFLLRRYSLHVHLAPSIVILAMETGERVVAEIFRDMPHRLIPYVSPGYSLGVEVMRSANAVDVFFLENHGLLVAADSLADLKLLLEAVQERFEKYLREHIHDYSPFSQADARIPDPVPTRFLFPDAVTYAHQTGLAAQEALGLQRYAEKMVARAGGAPRFLPESEVLYIKRMAAEQYRMQTSLRVGE